LEGEQAMGWRNSAGVNEGGREKYKATSGEGPKKRNPLCSSRAEAEAAFPRVGKVRMIPGGLGWTAGRSDRRKKTIRRERLGEVKRGERPSSGGKPNSTPGVLIKMKQMEE